MSQTEINASEERAQKLQRGLSNRHIQLIAIGGAIGTGLFMGSGKTISLAGPSIIIVYGIIGFFLFFMMRAMGELLLSDLNYKSFTDFSEDLLGPAAGFFVGWTYWFCWVVTGTADIIAISGYFHFWFPDMTPWAPAIGMVLLLVGMNLLSVKIFGELEFWFASIKILAILAIIVVSVYMAVTGFVSPAGHRAAVANLWENGGLFPKGLFGFFAGFQIALFAFVGIELLGTTAAETKDPEITLPRAINAVPARVVFFYIFALTAIMCITPWNYIEPGRSPFVTVFVLVGIPAAASVVNFVVLTSAASSANSGIYSTSRMLYGLSEIGVAPKIFRRLSKNQVPANGLIFSCLCLLIGSAMLIIMPSIMAAFTVMTTISSVLFIFVWSMIIISYLKYRKTRPERHAASIYKVPGGRGLICATQAFFIFVLILLCFEEDTREVLMITPIWFLTLAVGYHWLRKRQSRPGA
ncbi:MAG: D-serine/D-alanine/glycine transporter [Candidatus Adiutrix sp.]|jgi:D-serine/D-alanine/glycine transporter|nr:D-serine/D-alanine/glycine transporter [Candidatus Adiutrix sp.]